MLGTKALSHPWAILAGCVLICWAFAPSGYADEYFDKTCVNPGDCASNPGSDCLKFNSSTNKCGCNTALGFNKTGNICKVMVEIGVKCNGIYAFCKQGYSQCAHAGDLSSDKRCECKQDYVAVKDNNVIKCAKILTKADNENCTTCIKNDGTCYEFSDKSRKCKCPVSRIGAECDKILVNVQCKRYQLDVCYEPHPDVNLTSAHMYTHRYGTVPTCRARITTGSSNSTFCPKDRLRLTLNLSPDDMNKCGIQGMSFDADYTRYVAMISVTRSDTDTNPYLFRTYCEFQYRKNAQVEMAVVAVNGNDRGERKTPTMKFFAFDSLKKELKSGDSVRIQDPIGLTAMVAKDGVYTGIHVRRCVASSSPQIPDPKATTRLLYEFGCPADGQSYIPATGRWSLILGRINEWTTGFFPVFKLPQGASVYLHCTFKFCMGNETAMCTPPTCGQTTESGTAATTSGVQNNSTSASTAVPMSTVHSTATNTIVTTGISTSTAVVTTVRKQQCEMYYNTVASAFTAIEKALGLPPGTLSNSTQALKTVFMSTCNSDATTAAPSNVTNASQGSAAKATTASPVNATAAATTVSVAQTTAATNSSSNGTKSTGKRKKRALAQQVAASTGSNVPPSEVSMTLSLKTLEAEEIGKSPSTGVAAKMNMSNAAFAGLIGGVVLILLILMVVSALLLVRLRRQGPEDTDKVTMSDRPQRFALPRNNHLRL